MGIDVDRRQQERRRGQVRQLQRRRLRDRRQRGVARAPKTAADRDGDLLSKNPDINVVYTINEPAAVRRVPGAQGRGQGEGRARSCRSTAAAPASATSRTASSAPRPAVPGARWPSACRRSSTLVKDGKKPETTEGLDFFNTGVALVTDEPQDGVESIDTAEAKTSAGAEPHRRRRVGSSTARRPSPWPPRPPEDEHVPHLSHPSAGRTDPPRPRS